MSQERLELEEEAKRRNLTTDPMITEVPANQNGNAATGKKSRVRMVTMPANADDEEAKFFAALAKGEVYNPQLLYQGPVTNNKSLRMFPQPKFEYVTIAKKIMDGFLAHFGSHSNYLRKTGELLTDQAQVEKLIFEYLDELGPKVRAVAKVNFSDQYIAATSVSYDNDS